MKRKTINPFSVKLPGYKVRHNVFCTIEFDGTKLSITGVVGPRSNGYAVECGQISILELVQHEAKFRNGWSMRKSMTLANIWDKWHLNDMRPGCEHQREMHWGDKFLIIDGKGKFSSWVYESEHEDGVLCKPCPICGYKYGSMWLVEEIPDHIIEWLFDLPDSENKIPKILE